MSPRFLLALLALVLIPHPALSQEQEPDVRSWTCSRQVRSLCRWQGRTFAATSGGLLELTGNGSTARKWTTGSGLPDNDVLSLLPTGEGLVAAFRRSLGRHDGKCWSTLPPLPGADAGRAPSLAVHGGSLYAHSGAQLNRLSADGTSWERVKAPAKLTAFGGLGSTLYGLCERQLWRSADGKSWKPAGRLSQGVSPEAVVGWVRIAGSDLLAARNALFLLNGKSPRHLALSVPGGTHLSGVTGEGDHLLLAIHGSGLWSVSPSLAPNTLQPVSQAAIPDVRTVLVTAGSRLLGTTQGLRIRGRGKWLPVATADEIPAPTCAALAAFDGRPWLSTQDGSLSRFDSGHWAPAPRPGRSHLLQLVSGAGRLWARHPDGRLSSYDGRAWRPFVPEEFDRLSWSSSLTADASDLWIGTWGGAVRLATTAPNREAALDGFPFPGESATAVARFQGELWIGTQRRGLAVRAGDGGWRAVSEGSGPPESWITALAAGPDRLWVGTFNGGVACWDGREWLYPNPLPSPTGKKVTCLAIDRRGAAWVGTRGGLARFDGRQWTTWTQAAGLAGDEVQAILPLGDDVWVGTRSGVSRIRLSEASPQRRRVRGEGGGE